MMKYSLKKSRRFLKPIQNSMFIHQRQKKILIHATLLILFFIGDLLNLTSEIHNLRIFSLLKKDRKSTISCQNFIVENSYFFAYKLT